MSEALGKESAWVIGLIRKAAYPRLSTLSPAEARAQYDETSPRLDLAPVPVEAVATLAFYGPADRRSARIYTPTGLDPTRPAPALIFFHGGGWVVGNVETYDALCRTIATRAGVKVVSVEYRLAPEAPFPAAIEDAMAALAWVRAEAADLGLDPARLAIGGDSAGGNIAAALAQLDKPDGDPPLRYQWLIYPALDLTGTSPSREAFVTDVLLDRDLIDWFEAHYVPPAADLADPRLSPGQGPDLAGLAPALILTGGCDPLRDEGRAYATALATAGVAVEHLHYPGMIHGFFSMAGALETAQRAVAEAAAALGRAL